MRKLTDGRYVEHILKYKKVTNRELGIEKAFKETDHLHDVLFEATVGAEVTNIFSGYQMSLLAKFQRCFRDHLSPYHHELTRHQVMMKGRKMFPETSVITNQLTWMIARLDVIRAVVQVAGHGSRAV
jgi:hypothetical protein